jgi:amidase
MQTYLERINRYNPLYNAIVGMPDQGTLIEQAAAADEALDRGEYRGWMHGMPHAVKDLSNVRGLVTSSGSPIFANTVARADDIFVERIRGQGAIFIGKTNVPEFGLGSHSYNPVYGTTRNAYNPQLCAGGSSGGAACALATHMVPGADGSDMMGSLRNPAAYNNVIGFRPSQGRVPHPGSDLFFQQLGYEGPMGRCVEDTARLLGTMSGYDARVPMSLRDRVAAFKPPERAELKQYKVGWMGGFDGYLATEPGLLPLCERALAHLSQQGTAVEKCTPDYDMARLWQTWLTLRHWTICGSARPLYDNPDTRKLLKPEAVWEIEGGLELSGLDLTTATVARSDWYRALLTLFERYDFLVLPTAQVFPFSADIHWPKEIDGRAMDTYHRWMEVTIGGTLSGCPVVNLPAGFDAQGRPMGLQFIGPMGQDSKVLEFALAYEASVDFLARRPVLKESL